MDVQTSREMTAGVVIEEVGAQQQTAAEEPMIRILKNLKQQAGS